jgi:hypothetical protein
MPRPTVGPVAEELYADLAPYASADEENGWPLLALLGALCHPFEEIAELVRDDGSHPGWSILLDVDRCPAKFLPWLAQLAGVRLHRDMSESDRRIAIRERPGARRGTPRALRDAARVYLTGARSVRLTERVGGDAYQVAVRTLASETPDPARVLASLKTQLAAGLFLDYAAVDGQTYDHVNTDHADYAALRDAYQSYDGVRFDFASDP